MTWGGVPAKAWTAIRGIQEPIVVPPKPDVHAAWIGAVLAVIAFVAMEFWR